ncbi:NifU family protein [Anaplasmataceae bacterium AB001_6]|nr:NifU family protein [Anaplasmataceae bacterium AB001_6]
MFIQTVDTPNPNTLKFVTEVPVIDGKDSFFIRAIDKNKLDHDLVKALFELDFVESIFLSPDFLTVTKKENAFWDFIKPEILEIIASFCSKIAYDKKSNVTENNEEISEQNDALLECEFDPADSEIVSQINDVIEKNIRPALWQDGGNLIFKKYAEKCVYVILQGACVGCPSSTITLKQGVESLLRYYFPEKVNEVVALPHDVEDLENYIASNGE